MKAFLTAPQTSKHLPLKFLVNTNLEGEIKSQQREKHVWVAQK